MLAPTHLVGAQTAYLGACVAVGLAAEPAQGLAAAGAGLLPDLDRRASLPGRGLPFLSEPLEYWFGHRTLTHSALFLLALGAALWPLLGGGWWWAVMAGVASHQFLDWMTPRGSAWFWPSTARAVLPGSARFRIQPMSWAELAILCALGVVGVPLVWAAQVGHGSGGVITAAIADIKEARSQYDAERGRNVWRLEIEGTANATAKDISGTYRVRGPWRSGGFIVEGPEEPRSVCAGSSCDWYADEAVLHQGHERITTSRRIRAETMTLAGLRDAIAPLQEAGDVFLVGSLEARGVRSVPPTVEAEKAGSVDLRYTQPEELRDWPKRLRGVDLVVQVRHVPGKSVPKPDPSTGNNKATDPSLRRWVE